MHIGLLSPEYVTEYQLDGGLANYLKKISKGLTDKGHTVSVFTLSSQEREWKDIKVGANIYEIRRVEFPEKLSKYKYYRYLNTIYPFLTQVYSSKRISSRVWEIHKKNQIDILHTSNYLAPGFMLRNNQRIPLVCRISSYSPLLRSAQGMQRWR